MCDSENFDKKACVQEVFDKIEFWVRKLFLLAVLVVSVLAVSADRAEAKAEDGRGDGEREAEASRVFDYANLFRREEAEKLQEEAVRLREELKAEFIVLTIADAKGQTARENADEFYFSRGFDQSFDESGAVVLIDVDNREIYLGTYGIMIRVITDQRLDAVLDAAWPDAVDGDYASAALVMLGECEHYVHQGIVAGQYNYNQETGRIEVYRTIRWYEACAAAAISALVAGMVCLGVCQRYRMKGDDKRGDCLAYQNSSHVQIQPISDQLLHTAVHHTVIPQNHPSGGRSPGGSSSRRSTTHSHSGHRAGGGGRRF